MCAITVVGTVIDLVLQDSSVFKSTPAAIAEGVRSSHLKSVNFKSLFKSIIRLVHTRKMRL